MTTWDLGLAPEVAAAVGLGPESVGSATYATQMALELNWIVGQAAGVEELVNVGKKNTHTSGHRSICVSSEWEKKKEFSFSEGREQWVFPRQYWISWMPTSIYNPASQNKFLDVSGTSHSPANPWNAEKPTPLHPS